jgi:hypothetical protein
MCVCVYLRSNILCDYGVSEPGCKYSSVHILVKCNHTQVINNITLLHVDRLDKMIRGDKLHRKMEKGGLKS